MLTIYHMATCEDLHSRAECLSLRGNHKCVILRVSGQKAGVRFLHTISVRIVIPFDQKCNLILSKNIC